MYANNKMLFYWAYTVRNNYILIKLKYKVLSLYYLVFVMLSSKFYEVILKDELLCYAECVFKKLNVKS